MSKKIMNVEMAVRKFVAQDILTASVIGVSEEHIDNATAGAQGRQPVQAQPVQNNHPLNH